MDAVGGAAWQDVFVARVGGCRGAVTGGGEGFVDGDGDRGEFCGGHAGEVEEVEG